MSDTYTTAEALIALDVSEVGRKDTRERFRKSVEKSGHSWKAFQAFNENFGTSGERAPAGRLLVAGDLANLARRYHEYGRHGWVTSVRKTRPFFVAFVRTDRDRMHLALLDDLIRDSDSRLNVCGGTAVEEMLRCVTEAVSALDPSTLLEVRYSERRGGFGVSFGDGLAGFVTLADLGIDDLREEIVLESAIVGEGGDTLELTKSSGGLFEIDAASIRAVLDSDVAFQLTQSASETNAAVGQRVRAAREEAGLTQTELGARTEIDQAVISRLERGKHLPRIDTLRRIATALGTSVPMLLSGD